MKIDFLMMKRVWLFFCSALFLNIAGKAQEIGDLKTPEEPLVLQSQGSFYIGGETAEQTFEELGSFGPGSSITVNQMYVQYMVPATNEKKIPIIMVHGMALTGKTWETTPDGRMGWDEYFVRKGHASYVVDQVARGRSGFNQAILNQIRTGTAEPDKMPRARRFSDEWTWRNFRMGLEENQPFDVTLFPVDYLDELSKQGVPDISGILTDYSPNYKNLSELALKLDQAVLISHSQSGFFPMEAALINPQGIAGIVALEPGYCPTNLNNEQLQLLSKIPIFIIFGDYLEVKTGIEHSWQTACEQCETFSKQVNDLGGNAKVLRLPKEGIKGNSHMLMQDANSLELADSVIKWMEQAIKE